MAEIDFSELRADLTYEEKSLMSNERLMTVPYRNPNKIEYIRTHPDWKMPVYILNAGREEETYAVMPQCVQALKEMGVTKKVMLHAHINNGGVVFLSGITIPQMGERENLWNLSRAQAYEETKTEWRKLVADKNLGAYRIFGPEGTLPDPVWPQGIQNIEQLVQIAFKGRVIDSLEHPIVLRLRGLA